MTNGCLYALSWEGDLDAVMLGYSRKLEPTLEELAAANHRRLMVRKVMPAPNGPDDLDDWHQQYDFLRIVGSWYRLGQPLMDALMAQSDAWSYKAEQKLTGPRIVFCIIANPHEVSPYRTRVMANGIKQCRHYILWMAHEYQQAGQKLTPSELISHPSNDGRFKEKTIRNSLTELRKREFLCSDRHRGEVLTLFGRKELERLNQVIGL